MINTRTWLTGGQFIHTADKNCMVNLLRTKSHLNEYILKRKDSKFYWQTRKVQNIQDILEKKKSENVREKYFPVCPLEKLRKFHAQIAFKYLTCSPCLVR